MYPATFDYQRPGSVQEVVNILKGNPEAKIIAGGHSLLPAMKLRLARPGVLVDLAGISELKNISTNNGATIGAMVTYDEIMNNQQIADKYSALHQAASVIGDVQVRNRGTLAGSAAHSDPAADGTAAIVAHNAEVHVTGSNGERTIAADDFFIDIFMTALEPDEVITSIKFPEPEANTSSAYEKFSHPASGYPIVGIAAVVTRDGSGNVSSARIAATGSVLVATRLTGAEDAITGTNGDASAVEAAAAKATDGITEFAGDHYASAEYREHLTRVYTKRALNKALGNA